jgi:hypothetical protein
MRRAKKIDEGGWTFYTEKRPTRVQKFNYNRVLEIPIDPKRGRKHGRGSRLTTIFREGRRLPVFSAFSTVLFHFFLSQCSQTMHLSCSIGIQGEHVGERT